MKLLSLIIGVILLAQTPAPPTPPSAPQTPGTIKGVVLAESGQPVFGIEVHLSHVVRKHKHTATSTDLAVIHHHGLASTSTLRDGAFVFSGLQPGEYLVAAGNKRIGRGHANVTVTAGKISTVQIHLEPVVPH